MRTCRTFALSLLTLAPLANEASAQTQAGTAVPTQQWVISLYIARHEATARFAELGLQASEKGVSNLAERLRDEHRKAGEKLEQDAQKENVTILRPPHDTADVMLANAIQALKGKSGRDFDSTFSAQAYGWLATLILDNNKNVVSATDGELKKFAQAYGTFLFHQMSDAGKLKKKYEKK